MWKANDGKSELKTDGVPAVEVYLYRLLDSDTIKYVNTIKDPSADCQANYEFVECPVKKQASPGTELCSFQSLVAAR